MSQFSKKLKYLIENSGLSVYQLSKNANIDRTTIQRAVSGERLPNMDFVLKLCSHLCISPPEQSELLELYNICKIGPKIYSRRKYVMSLLNQIADLHITKSDNTSYIKSIKVDIDSKNDIVVFMGEYNVNNVLMDIIEEETSDSDKPHIILNVPFKYAFLYNFLYQIYWEHNGRIEIDHIVRFDRSPDAHQNSNINLEILAKILPLAFCVGNGYKPYYYYTEIGMPPDISITMPYYILTEKRLVTISDDFKMAVLYNNDDIIFIYRYRFQQCLEKTTPLLNEISDCSDYVSSYFNAIIKYGEKTNVISPQPHFAKYISSRMMSEHIKRELVDRDRIIRTANNYFDYCRNFAGATRSFFSVDGVRYFAETGEIATFPNQFVYPFDKADRRYLLNSLINDIRSKDAVCRAVNPSKLHISSLASLELYKNNGIFLCAAEKDNIISCNITEHSICGAFGDFFDYMTESDLVYSKEETLDVLAGAVSRIENTEPAKTV